MCALPQLKNVLRVLVLNHVVVLARHLRLRQLSTLLDIFASPGTVFGMDSKTDLISVTSLLGSQAFQGFQTTTSPSYERWLPRFHRCRVGCGSMLAAGARFLSDQSATGEMVVWSIDSVDGWCSRAVAAGMAESTMTRYRSWLRRIARVAQGLRAGR